MNGWKYTGSSMVLLLARRDDFTGVPVHAQTAFQGVSGVAWGDRPGNPLPDHLSGASRSDIDEALKGKGWFLYPP